MVVFRIYHVICGVCQGGVLSPLSFAVCVDNILCKLQSSIIVAEVMEYI